MRIALTIGDPNGIGPEIAVKAAAHFADSGIEAVIVGDEFVMRPYLARHAAGKRIETVAVKALDEAAFAPGVLDARAGAATVAYVRAAMKLVAQNEVAAIVACPHSEIAINAAGICFSGYPGLVAELTGTPPERVFLMLVAAGLRIAHVTLHESVRDALTRMTPQLVAAAGHAAVAATRQLGVANPRLAVFGINPHAGEGGLFGDDDARITEPALALLHAQGVQADGPGGGDVLLSQRRHDVYLAMFHDQGHIPIKLISPLQASALVIGSPVLFSSVGHGCAYDIAGKGIGDPAALIATLELLGGAAAV